MYSIPFGNQIVCFVILKFGEGKKIIAYGLRLITKNVRDGMKMR